MLKIKKILVFSFLFVCCNSTNSYYKNSQVNLLFIDNSESKFILVYYSIPLESIYYSSGIDFFYNYNCNQIEIKVVRQKINTKVDVMLKSSLLKNTEDSLKMNQFGLFSYVVKIPKNKKWQLDNSCYGKLIKIVD